MLGAIATPEAHIRRCQKRFPYNFFQWKPSNVFRLSLGKIQGATNGNSCIDEVHVHVAGSNGAIADGQWLGKKIFTITGKFWQRCADELNFHPRFFADLPHGSPIGALIPIHVPPRFHPKTMPPVAD